MKSCPKCNRTFPDEGQKFCTFDGGLLIAPQTLDPNATISATTIDLNSVAEKPTSRDLPDPNATIVESYPATVALPRNTGPTTGPTGTSPNTSDIAKPPAAPPPMPPPPPPVTVTPPPPPPPPAEQPPVPAVQPEPAQTPAPSTPLPQVAPKKSKVPLIIAGVFIFLLLSGGALAALFFFVVKPKLDELAAERNPERPVVVSTPTPTSSVEAPSPAPTAEDTFVPPSGTVQFANSNENLDGKLAEHYFDFSFYYPESWVRDLKSGVPGATNFVKVDRMLPPDFTQENFAVGWYTSTGTFAGDSRSFPQRAEEFSKSLARIIPDYKKVSEGQTKVNSMDAYEFRWEGLSKGTERGDLNLWGRVIFLPTGKEGDTTGATLTMLCTSLAGELSSVEDVGERGQSPVILESFRFGKKK